MNLAHSHGDGPGTALPTERPAPPSQTFVLHILRSKQTAIP